MKICYIWVEKFRNFENFGFNLSSSCKFKFNEAEGVLSVDRITPLPNGFFGERIDDVIGIIGKNGAGKSNAVELVCKILKGSKTSFQSDFFLISEDNDELVCHYSFGNRKKIKTSVKISFKEYVGAINPLKVVFFSNVFDERRNGFNSEVSDISVNNLFTRNIFLRRSQTSEFEKQIRLIDSKIFPSLNIDLPKQVQLTSKVWTNRLSSSQDYEVYGNSSEDIRALKQMLRDRLREIRPENKFIHLLRIGFFFEMFNKVSRRSRYRERPFRDEIDKLAQFVPTLFDLRTEEISERLIDFLRYVFSNLTSSQLSLVRNEHKAKDYESQRERILKQISFLQNVKYSLLETEMGYETEGSRNKSVEYFTFSYQQHQSRDFINQYMTLFGESSFFETTWIGISSGHKAYINLFASLYQELRYTRQTNLLLCIDEGDLYLHPMWQTEFFAKLISVLPKIFSGSIQLILTSHSPFILSDLPKQNITILDKDVTNSSQDGTALNVDTFGGNLYDLYSEPFFLGKKRTSDFAYNKIKNLIELAENQSISKKDKKAALKVVSLIGDQIIQFRLKKLLEND